MSRSGNTIFYGLLLCCIIGISVGIPRSIGRRQKGDKFLFTAYVNSTQTFSPAEHKVSVNFPVVNVTYAELQFTPVGYQEYEVTIYVILKTHFSVLLFCRPQIVLQWFINSTTNLCT